MVLRVRSPFPRNDLQERKKTTTCKTESVDSFSRSPQLVRAQVQKNLLVIRTKSRMTAVTWHATMYVHTHVHCDVLYIQGDSIIKRWVLERLLRTHERTCNTLGPRIRGLIQCVLFPFPARPNVQEARIM